MSISLNELPNEIIHEILLYVPPISLTKVQQVSRHFNHVSQPILWRHHCRTQFEYWDPDHRIREKFSGPVVKVDWKKIFSGRLNVDRVINHEIDSILETQVGRIEKTERIVAHGYDAKDTLLRNLTTGEEADDVLARRFYSDAVLGNLHRSMAIQEWIRLRNGEAVSLERALAAFDMFVLHERKGDFSEVATILDQIAENLRLRDPVFDEGSPRRQAIALATHLRDMDLAGITSDSQYHNLQNNFIGIALQDANHPSLPLISVAIFCCIARRLGIDAQPCAFPFHVLAIVKPAPGLTLDGKNAHHSQVPTPMYMDPFRSNHEMDVRDLKAQLCSLGVAPVDYPGFLDVSSVEEIVRRCATNIITSIQALPRQDGAPPMSTVPSFPEMDGALYAALWSLMLLPKGDRHLASLQRSRYLPLIVEKMEREYLADVGMIEEHILPLILDPGRRQNLIETIRVVRTGDQMPKQIKHRNPETERRVKYKVGQVFRHKRYHYQGVITGWDLECEAGDQWIYQMDVRSLSKGQHQSFYHVLVEDQSVRYVAEENIEMTSHAVDKKLMALAGQHFKRWDEASAIFVSNIIDEYPDH